MSGQAIITSMVAIPALGPTGGLSDHISKLLHYLSTLLLVIMHLVNM